MNFGDAWHRMSDSEKEDFMATVVAALYLNGKLTNIEAEEARQYFMVNGTDKMSQGVIKVYEALNSGLVKFSVDTNSIIICITSRVDTLLSIMCLLPPMQQYEMINSIIKELKDIGEITNEEADEAFADILKLFTYENYTHHSKGTKKVLASLYKILDA